VRLNLAHTLARSAANGPGERFALWVQGCPLACPGCWNPDTWSFTRRELREVVDLTAEIAATPGIDGVTFTGYELDELTSAAHCALLAVTDVLVAGRYVEAERTESLAWRGSSNQRVHFLTARYGPGDVTDAPEAEILLGPDGGLHVTGFPSRKLLCRPGMAEVGGVCP